MAGDLFGPYRVGTRLGKGGMGEVHEAFDTHRERTVALKRLHTDDQDDPDVRERFRRESRIAARLDSPHVVPIHDFGVIDGRMFIDMRLVRGRDLGALIHAEGALRPERAVHVVEQVADALDAAHQAGIVHRDVKPSNVLLAQRDFVYLADFGIVHVREATEQPRLTATGSTLGTPAYMAPEQLRADPFDQRLDVYALGCVLFEALTGRPPFVGERLAVMLSHLNDAPPRPSSFAPLSAGLDDVVLTALAKAPSGRFPTTGALAAAAAEVVRQDAKAAESLTEARTFETAPARPAPPPRRPVPLRPVPPPRPMPTPDDGLPGSGADVTGPIPRPVPEQHHSATPESGKQSGLVTLVLAVVVPPVGAVLGLLARRRGETTRGTAALAIGAVLTVVAIVAAILFLRTPAVPASTVEAQIVAQSGLAADQVSCPDSLPAEVGASVVCTVSNGGRTQQLRASVTGVNDRQVTFDIIAE
ncbi:protein kinase domain-containing protein [Actinomycetospora soli]|uniref:protein kinase domain-containing protein n=1 Tax=Actinomycetospora soli TaxID=2893887 RepID=UPI001E3009E9|nr:protein kinase [Actinomycetospora soli]MCD2187809.1 protein kinase [Actinomycetospora soli]